MQHRLRSALLFPSLIVAGVGLFTSTAFGAGGTVALRTDNGADGYYYGLGGSGVDRFINEYLANSFDPGSIICGARLRELNQGVIPPPGQMGGDLRFEDPVMLTYPDLSPAGLIATVDVASQGTCSGGTTRNFTFGGGAGVPDPIVRHYISAIEPLHGTTGTLDFCGTLLDTSSAGQGFAKYYSGGVFGSIPWNHFIEEIVFTSKRMDLNIRASGSARYPGDRGIPVVFTRRPNAAGTVTDDNMTLSISIDNGTGGSIGRNLRICADQTVIDPKKGLKEITGFFRPVGGGGAIMNPITLPSGRTILKLEVSAASVKSKAANIVNKRVLNLPLRVLVDDPAVDTDACALDGGADVDDETQILGLRRTSGSYDDNSVEAFFTVQSPSLPGDALNVCWEQVDFPKVDFVVTGIEVVGGEFGGSGLPGLDAIEIRFGDPIFEESPDLSPQGLRRAVGTADGIGEVPLGVAPSTRFFDWEDYFGRTWTQFICPDDFPRVIFAAGETVAVTALAADTDPADTLVGMSTVTSGGENPSTLFIGANWMIRPLLDGDRGTLDGVAQQATMIPNAVLRTTKEFIAIDRSGRRLQ